MQEIDLSQWKRKQHFAFFRNSDLPFYNINTQVDITGIPEFAREQALSFNNLMMFLCIKALNSVENFRYRLRGETVVLHDALHPSFAHIKDGDDDLFSLITLDFIDDLQRFDQAVKTAIDHASTFFDLAKLRGRDDFVFFSSLPWISFTGVDHTLSLNKDDGIPRITWGKFTRNGPATSLPFNIRVNHMFVDGIHVGQFFAALEKEIGMLKAGSGD